MKKIEYMLLGELRNPIKREVVYVYLDEKA